MSNLAALKTHLSEQIALAEKEPECTCADWGMMGHTESCAITQYHRRSPATLNHSAKLCRQLQVALEVIESSPHDDPCAIDTIDYCDCWKSRAIDRILEAGV